MMVKEGRSLILRSAFGVSRDKGLGFRVSEGH